jgi:hypothetical protein
VLGYAGRLGWLALGRALLRLSMVATLVLGLGGCCLLRKLCAGQDLLNYQQRNIEGFRTCSPS